MDDMNLAAALHPEGLAAPRAAELPATMEAFLAQVQRRAFRVAEMSLGNADDALDAVQDAMLRLHQHYRQHPAQEWSPLFWGILRRRITDLQRRRKVRSIVVGWLRGAGEDGEDGPVWEPVDVLADPAREIAGRAAYADLSRAVRALPRRQREAFMLRMLEGLDVAATARAMGCSGGSVKTHLSRAMEALRHKLEDWK